MTLRIKIIFSTTFYREETLDMAADGKQTVDNSTKSICEGTFDN